jgi:hypothetical protein
MLRLRHLFPVTRTVDGHLDHAHQTSPTALAAPARRGWRGIDPRHLDRRDPHHLGRGHDPDRPVRPNQLGPRASDGTCDGDRGSRPGQGDQHDRHDHRPERNPVVRRDGDRDPPIRRRDSELHRDQTNRRDVDRRHRRDLAGQQGDEARRDDAQPTRDEHRNANFAGLRLRVLHGRPDRRLHSPQRHG